MASNKKNNKIKNIIITIIEILVVAGIIYSAMTFVLNKIDKDADIAVESETKEEKGSGNYSIEVNIAKNAMIIYEIDDNKNKKAVKVFPVSVGKDIEKGKYTIEEKYSWVRIGDKWSQYGSKIGSLCYIGSASYNDNYPETLDRKSYNKIGQKKADGKSILLYAKDANWIYENCKTGTKVNVSKGSDTDELPLAMEVKTQLAQNCDWDPTDPNENNPYLKATNGTITLGEETIYVEKYSKVDYLANVLALDGNGVDISDQLTYKKINTDELGSKKIKYSITTSDGQTLTSTQIVEIIDTTCPVVSCSSTYFTYEAKGRGSEHLNNEEVVKAIESMVRNRVSVNESGCSITVKTVSPGELIEGEEVPVSIKAQDPSGNIGSLQVTCKITVKKATVTDKNTPKKIIEQLEKESKEAEKESKKNSKEE